MYPRILINMEKLNHNATTMSKWLTSAGLNKSFVVTKMFAGDIKLATLLSKSGFAYLADSRIDNLKRYRNIPIPKALLRLPMHQEAKDIVKFTDISLHSEVSTIQLLNDEAKKMNKIHKIVLMFDVGDLREGIWFEEDYIPLVTQILSFSHIKLYGIGINLTCYGGVIPSVQNTNILIQIKNKIELHFGIKLDMISGGNSSSMNLLLNNQLPNEVNNLRLGEAVVLGKETAYGQPIEGLYQDVFTLQAKVIEIKEKPSYPVGEIGVDSFGEVPKIIDKGNMLRAIVALGKQDIAIGNLVPCNPMIEVIGGSSDHLILDVTKHPVKMNDTISFHVNYPGLLQLMTSKYVKKVYVNK